MLIRVSANLDVGLYGSSAIRLVQCPLLYHAKRALPEPAIAMSQRTEHSEDRDNQYRDVEGVEAIPRPRSADG